jgi:pimeloyl-ACP methyl ester carboxylesterase
MAVLSLAGSALAGPIAQGEAVRAATHDDTDIRDESRREHRRFIRWVFGKVTGEAIAPIAPELVLPAERGAREPLIVLVHGLGGGADTWESMRAAFTKNAPELAIAEFRYDSRQPIADSARQLSEKLAAQAGIPIYLVAHSLGGLVARDCVEDPGLDPGNVRSLVLLGVPNGGARMAQLHAAFDLVELVASRPASMSTAAALAREAARRVLADARDDISPDSQLLKDLASRPRNPRVEYHAVAGTGAPLNSEATELIRLGAERAIAKLPESSPVSTKVRELVSDLTELERGSGDGIVATSRARLDGVNTNEVKATHTGLPRDSAVQEMVLRWLRERRKRDLSM